MNTLFLQATLAGVIATAFSLAAHAGAGHDHDHETPPAASADGPRRLPDGSVFLPKVTQRQLAVRTVVTEHKALPQSFELAGRVVMDPNAGGKVQPMAAGRMEPGPKGLPSLGQAVRKGDILAFVRPSAGALERANQVALAAELRSAAALAEKRLGRLKQLEGTVPRKDIEAAEAEAASARERLAAIGGSLSATEALTAPVSGVIAASNVVAGQVVDAREVLFEIVDPGRLRVEAVAHDAALAANIAAATARASSGESIALEFVGAGRTLREQAVPIQFRTRAGKDGGLPALTTLAVGQPLKVVVQTRTTVDGVAVPASAIVKSPSNQDIVWVHDSAERFLQRPVRHVPLDASAVTVIQGLKGGERVVVQGAPLVNQVR